MSRVNEIIEKVQATCRPLTKLGYSAPTAVAVSVEDLQAVVEECRSVSKGKTVVQKALPGYNNITLNSAAVGVLTVDNRELIIYLNPALKGEDSPVVYRP